jgi:hypothetical protein
MLKKDEKIYRKIFQYILLYGSCAGSSSYPVQELPFYKKGRLKCLKIR